MKQSVKFIWSANGEVFKRVRDLPLSNQLLRYPMIIYFVFNIALAVLIFTIFGNLLIALIFVVCGLLSLVGFSLWITWKHSKNRGAVTYV